MLDQLDPNLDPRLRWRCRRGLLELDLVLQEFLSTRYSSLNEDERAQFDHLLELPDDSLLAYVQGRKEPVELNLKKLIKKII